MNKEEKMVMDELLKVTEELKDRMARLHELKETTEIFTEPHNVVVDLLSKTNEQLEFVSNQYQRVNTDDTFSIWGASNE